MSPIEKIAAYLVAAEEMADALGDLLDAVDPDLDGYQESPDAHAALHRFRRQGLELSGQASLAL